MVFEKVREILCDQLDIDPDEVTLDTDIIDDLGADSLDVVEMLMAMEEAFGFAIPDGDIEDLITVSDVVAYVESNC